MPQHQVYGSSHTLCTLSHERWRTSRWKLPNSVDNSRTVLEGRKSQANRVVLTRAVAFAARLIDLFPSVICLHVAVAAGKFPCSPNSRQTDGPMSHGIAANFLPFRRIFSGGRTACTQSQSLAQGPLHHAWPAWPLWLALPWKEVGRNADSH